MIGEECLQLIFSVWKINSSVNRIHDRPTFELGRNDARIAARHAEIHVGFGLPEQAVASEPVGQDHYSLVGSQIVFVRPIQKENAAYPRERSRKPAERFGVRNKTARTEIAYFEADFVELVASQIEISIARSRKE